ncbi:hypothetical protein ACFY41_28375 [Streptomyces syringium]|uniref:hypothetical protein n=1 Tax=Streptomyces syringium TaxID=76729 RepID=UPI0036A6BFAA
MRTLLRALVDQREWQAYDVFRLHFERAASELAKSENNPSLAGLSVSDSTYQRWYYGSGRPHPGSRRVLRHLFGYSVDELWAEEPAPACPADEGSTSTHTESWAAPDTHVRRRIGQHVAAAARQAMEFAVNAEHCVAGPETLGYLQSEVRRITQMYNRVPVADILDDLTHMQAMTFRLLESGRTKPSQARDLYLLAALQAGMLAKASHDLGDPQSAMLQARAAAVCADQAEHQAMRAWVRGLQSGISYWADRPDDALRYAREGTAKAADVRGSVTVWLAAQEARAAARVGDAETAHAACCRAEELREHTAPDDLDDLGGNFVFPQIRQTYFAVEASVLLGSGSEALVRRAEEAVRGFSDTDNPHWSFGAEAGCRSNLALARLYTGDLEGTTEAVQPILDLPLNRRNAGIVSSVNRVRTSLKSGPARNARAADELREQLAAFSTHSALIDPRQASGQPLRLPPRPARHSTL